MQEKKGMWLKPFKVRKGILERNILTQGIINMKLAEGLIKGKQWRTKTEASAWLWDNPSYGSLDNFLFLACFNRNGAYAICRLGAGGNNTWRLQTQNWNRFLQSDNFFFFFLKSQWSIHVGRRRYLQRQCLGSSQLCRRALGLYPWQTRVHQPLQSQSWPWWEPAPGLSSAWVQRWRQDSRCKLWGAGHKKQAVGLGRG